MYYHIFQYFDSNIKLFSIAFVKVIAHPTNAISIVVTQGAIAIQKNSKEVKIKNFWYCKVGRAIHVIRAIESNIAITIS